MNGIQDTYDVLVRINVNLEAVFFAFAENGNSVIHELEIIFTTKIIVRYQIEKARVDSRSSVF